MRNSYEVQVRVYEDDGYTHICPVCAKRSGKGKTGPRTLEYLTCPEHAKQRPSEHKTKLNEVLSLARKK